VPNSLTPPFLPPSWPEGGGGGGALSACVCGGSFMCRGSCTTPQGPAYRVCSMSKCWVLPPGFLELDVHAT
jgi:hypothetical protein